MSVFNELIGETSALKWARAFVVVAELRPDIPTDEGTMIGWFANAIESGRDAGKASEQSRSIDDRIREIAYLAAGAGSGAVMVEAPDVIMPSGVISRSVDRILSEHGIAIERRDEDAVNTSGDSWTRAASFEPGQSYGSENPGSSSIRRETESDRLLREHRQMEP